MDTMKVPIRFRNGGVEKFADQTDEFFAHLLALSVQIIPNELPLSPQFGVEDPTFNDTLTRDLAFTAGAFIPEITISRARVNVGLGGRTSVDIAFDRRV